jgi:hypothetical protein
MLKEPYLSPEVKSETMEYQVLCNNGSPMREQVTTEEHDRCWLKKLFDPSCGFCCED